MVIAAVKARAYALRGDDQACRRQLALAEQAHAEAQAEPVQGWRGTVATAEQLHAGAGHALATLARRADSVSAREEAQVRLAAAVDALDPIGHARAAALCLAQLTALHLEAGELDQAIDRGRRLASVAGGVRSDRLAAHLAVVRKAAGAHEHDTTVMELVADLDAWLVTVAGEQLGRDPRR